MSKKSQTVNSALITLLADAGYEVVEGYENVKDMIQQKADNSPENLCSGYRVFPDGTKCNGCSDCKVSVIKP